MPKVCKRLHPTSESLPCVAWQFWRVDVGSRSGATDEIKHDGFRIMARRDGAGVRLIARNGNDFTKRFPLAAAAVAALPGRSSLIDGEGSLMPRLESSASTAPRTSRRIQPVDATPFHSIWRVGTVCKWKGCTDVGHAEAKGKALRAPEERPMGGRRRPTARETRAVSKILALNGGIAPAPRLECSSE
jgi:hypothetical protein